MDEAIRRLQTAAAVGADVAFIEGFKTKELLEATVKALEPIPVRSFPRPNPLIHKKRS
jgi:2-methylisocitrate lyase-like PEP mutase family enzyme